MSHDSILRETVTVDIEDGLHLRPCSMIARVASEFACDFWVVNADIRVDAKRVLELPMLRATQGTKLILEASGEGAAAAIDAVMNLFRTQFQVE